MPESLFKMPFEEINTEYDLGKAIIDEMGLSVGEEYVLHDQETGVPVQFQGKNVKFSATNPELVYIGNGDVLFDPVHNLQMINKMMGMYLDKEAEEGNEIMCMYDDFNKDEKTTSHTIKFSPENKVTSHYYKNKCLSICDNFMQLANLNNDLSKFDDDEEVE
jgi:hypothetical protein